MITYSSQKFNKIYKKINEILVKNNININDAEQNLSGSIIEEVQVYCQNILESADKFLSVPCPKCGQTHLEHFSSNYQRNVIFRIGNILLTVTISVSRLKCGNCNSTHALLPDFCIPLKQYSKQAVLSIVKDAVATSTEKVSSKLNIDQKQVRRFVNVVKTNKNNVLLIYHKNPKEFKSQLNDKSTIAEIINSLSDKFSEEFFKEFGITFLYEKNKRKLYMQYSKLSM